MYGVVNNFILSDIGTVPVVHVRLQTMEGILANQDDDFSWEERLADRLRLMHGGIGFTLSGNYYDGSPWLTLVALYIPLVASVVGLVGNLLLRHNIVSSRHLQTIGNSYLYKAGFADFLFQSVGLLHFIMNTIGVKFSRLERNAFGCAMLMCSCVSALHLRLYAEDLVMEKCPTTSTRATDRSQLLQRRSTRCWYLVWSVIVMNVIILAKVQGGYILCSEYSYFFSSYHIVSSGTAIFVFISLVDAVLKIKSELGWSEVPQLLIHLTLVYGICQIPQWVLKSVIIYFLSVSREVELYTLLLVNLNHCLNLLVYMKFHPELLTLSNL